MKEPARNAFGLTARDMDTIGKIFAQYPEIHQVRLFGSRAKGNYKLGSDIDLAIIDDNIDHVLIRKLRQDFEESSLPYFVDIVHLPSLQNKEFIDHIKRLGQTIYSTDLHSAANDQAILQTPSDKT